MEPTQSLQKPLTLEYERGLSTQAEYEAAYWKRFQAQSRPNIFGHAGIHLAKDSGYRDVGKLLSSSKYVYAVEMAVLLVANVYMIFKTDVFSILQALQLRQRPCGPGDQSVQCDFLLTEWIIRRLSPKGAPFWLSASFCVPLFEGAVLIILLGRMVCYAVTALTGHTWYTVRSQEEREHARWSHAQSLFCYLFPEVASFSALRLLYHVTPAVVGTVAYQTSYIAIQHFKSSSAVRWLRGMTLILGFILTRLMCLVIGFDAFLVKFRMAKSYIAQQQISANAVLAAFIFLFQTMGIVNLSSFVRERLFVFTFAGEDGDVENSEMARAEVWQALITREIYRHFAAMPMGFLKFVVVMLGFSDYDLQFLVLDHHDPNEPAGL